MTTPTDYAAAHNAAALFDVSGRGKIEVAGNDAVVFLHNLCTNDIKNLPPGTGCEAFFCTPTARVVAHGWIWREPPQGKRERLWLDLPAGLANKVYEHLDRHLISEDVTLTDHTQTLAQLHLCGPKAVDLLAGVGVQISDGWRSGLFRTEGPLTVRCVDPLGLPGVDLLCPQEQGPVLKDRLLAPGAVPGSAETYDILRIEAGTPAYGVDLDDTTFAPEAGRTAQAISYAKGCYLGQEPIVMARDRGVVQRQLVGLFAPEAPPPGARLYSRDGKEVGRVTSAVRSPRFGAIALAYVRRTHLVPGTELEADLVVGGTRQEVKVAKLPFASAQ